MLFIRIKRKKISYKYKKDMKAKDDWHNNDNNSCLDDFELFDYESRIFTAKCQTVSNIPGGRYQDTISPGPFLVKCFIEKRNFHCEVHGICQTSTLDYSWIDDDCTTASNKERWLIHDDQKLKPNPPNQVTRIPWSAGCIVLRYSDHKAFNDILKAYGVVTGFSIDGEILQEE